MFGDMSKQRSWCKSVENMKKMLTAVVVVASVIAQAEDSLETEMWQDAIDRAATIGGGRVTIPSGRHVVGELFLKSNVELYLSEGSELVGSGDFADYPLQNTIGTQSQKDLNGWCALIFAANATNVAITGRGIIDGRGYLQAVNARLGGEKYDLDGRSRNILFVSCNGVSVRDVTLRNPAMWTQHYFDCEHVNIENVKVFARANHNNDGLDVDSCRHVIIRGCNIDSTDDALVFKTTSLNPCEDVLVENCRLSSQATALKFGTESYGDFRRFKIRNLTILPSRIVSDFEHPCHLTNGISAIEISTVDGGLIEDIDIYDVSAMGSEAAFFLRVGARCRPLRPNGRRLIPGKMRHVRIANLTAKCIGNFGSSVTAYEMGRITDVQLENISIETRGGISAGDYLADDEFDDQADGYPSPFSFGNLPARGLYFRNAGEVSVKQCEFKSIMIDARPERLSSWSAVGGSSTTQRKAGHQGEIQNRVPCVY